MAKTKLTKGVRDGLIEFAEKSVVPDAEMLEHAIAYKAALPIIRKEIQERYPAKDMAVLRKYNLASSPGKDRTLSVINFGLPDGGGRVIRVHLHAEDGLPIPYDDLRGWKSAGYSSRDVFSLTESDFKIVEHLCACEEAIEQRRSEMLKHYAEVVFSVPYAEDLLAIWPAASAILDDYIASKSRGLPAASGRAIEFVKSDNAGSLEVSLAC